MMTAEQRSSEPISPELVLVDSELAERARARLPSRVEAERPVVAPPEVEPIERRRTSRSMRALRLLAAIVVVGTILSPGLNLLCRPEATNVGIVTRR